MGQIEVKRIEDKEVLFGEWAPKHEPQDYPPEFVAFIDSILADFNKISYYRPFELYKQQAKWWSEKDTTRIEQYLTKEDQLHYIRKERDRCAHNTFYAILKYGYLKDGNAPDGSGKVKCIPTKAQQIILFLQDSGYSIEGLKGRQIGFTSVMGLSSVLTINFRKNYFLKFVASSAAKGQEIFNDKMKDVLYYLPEWLISNIEGNSRDQLWAAKKGVNKRKIGRNSRIKVDTPAIDVINGGSPQRVLVDEVGLIDKIYAKMKAEGRPTMYFYNPETGKLTMRRQFIGWGTSGEMDIGGSVLEEEFYSCLKAWKEREFSYGIIPLFFSWKARIGATQELYESEKRMAYSTGDPDKILKFHQAWPDSIEDCFLRSTKTLVPLKSISEAQASIFAMDSNDQPMFGRYVPIFDTSIVYPESFKIPHKIIGADFQPTSGPEDPMTTACIFIKPQAWLYRFYQGIDPINAETGHSLFSASIWDKYEATFASTILYRERDYQMCYLQALLQRIYYSQGLPDLIKCLPENNIGDDMMNFWSMLGFNENTIVGKLELPPSVRSGDKQWGISNRPNTAGGIVGYMSHVFNTYISNIKIYWYLKQLRTFVEKDLKTQTSLRETRWQAQNKKIDYDDALFSGVFAYIAAETDSDTIPISIEKYEEHLRSSNRKKLVWVPGRGNVYMSDAEYKSHYRGGR